MKSLSECTVLVVDDAPENLMILSGILENLCQVRGASSGLDALAVCNESAPDLILLDVLMGGIDGFATCQRLKENPDTAGIPVVFITSLSDQDDKVRGFESGGVDFITRPFDASEVRSRVSTHLRLYLLEQDQKNRIGRLAEALENSEETYQFFAEHTDDLLVQLDPGGRVSMINRGWRDMTGTDRGAVLGKPLAEIVFGEDAARVEKALLAGIQDSRESIRIEFRLDTKAGVRWMRAAIRLRYSDSGQLVGLTGIVTDIHDLIQHSQDLRASHEASRAAADKQLHLLEETAHRFRTPLQDIAGSLSLLRDLPVDPVGREFVEQATAGCESLNTVLEEMLDNIRKAPPGLPPTPPPLDLPPFQPDASRSLDSRVLIVDDSPINLQILDHLVRRIGFAAVDAVETGAEALEFWDRHRHPLVLLDCQMPDPDGFAVCRKLRSHPDSTRATIIAVSACALPENLAQCLEAGFDHQIEKPVTIDSLRQLLSSFGWPAEK